MRPPDDVELPAPEFPPELEWLNVPFVRMDKLLGSGAALVEFWDFARVNSLRTLPYLQAWHERYASAGLRVVGVHSPGYSCSRDRDGAAAMFGVATGTFVHWQTDGFIACGRSSSVMARGGESGPALSTSMALRSFVNSVRAVRSIIRSKPSAGSTAGTPSVSSVRSP